MKTLNTKQKTASYLNRIVTFTYFFILLFPATSVSYGKGPQHSSKGACETCTSELMETNLKAYRGVSATLEGIMLQSTELIDLFYEGNNYQTAWTTESEVTAQGLALIELLKESYHFGIEPSIFNIDELELYAEFAKEKKEKKSAKYRAQFELLLTNAAFTFMMTVANGNESIGNDKLIKNKELLGSLPNYLNKIKDSENIAASILELQPQDELYVGLQAEMSQLVTFIDHIESKDSNKDIHACIELFEFLFEMEGSVPERADRKDKEYFEYLVSEYQKGLQVRQSGKVTAYTRHSISRLLITNYAELAYQVEKIRSGSNFQQMVAALK